MSNNKRSSLLLPQSETMNVQSIVEIEASVIKTKPKALSKLSFFEDGNNDDKKSEMPKPYSAKKEVLSRTGYSVKQRIASTLQGSVYHAINDNGDRCVIKRASANLVEQGIAIVNSGTYRVDENIEKEASMMKYLTNLSKTNNASQYMVKYIDSFNDSMNYFLLMENGGQSFFNHVKIMHDNIKAGELAVKTWVKHVEILAKQMCEFVLWMHEVKVAHLDISLENMLIKNCIYKNGKFYNHGIIKFIDFGLSELITKDNKNKCTKYVGKTNYKCPKVYESVPFNVKKADVWSLGCVLFMALFGCMPYMKPTDSDTNFNTIIQQNIRKWAKKSGKKKVFK